MANLGPVFARAKELDCDMMYGLIVLLFEGYSSITYSSGRIEMKTLESMTA